MAWRFRSRDNLNTVDEAFTNCALPTPPGPTPSGQLGRRLWIPQTTWFSPFCFFWKVNKHGAISIPRKALGLRPNDQSCDHETWLHLDFVDWSNKWSNQDYNEGNIRVKEGPGDFSHGTPKRQNSEGFE